MPAKNVPEKKNLENIISKKSMFTKVISTNFLPCIIAVPVICFVTICWAATLTKSQPTGLKRFHTERMFKHEPIDFGNV